MWDKIQNKQNRYVRGKASKALGNQGEYLSSNSEAIQALTNAMLKYKDG